MLLPLLEAGTLDSVDGWWVGLARKEDLPNLPSPSLLIFLILPPFHRSGLTLFPAAPWSGWSQSSCQLQRSFLRSHSGLFPLTVRIFLTAIAISMFPSLGFGVPWFNTSPLPLAHLPFISSLLFFSFSDRDIFPKVQFLFFPWELIFVLKVLAV